MRKLTASLICVVLLCSGCGSDDKESAAATLMPSSDDRGLQEMPESTQTPAPQPYRIDPQWAPPTALERPPLNGILPEGLKPPRIS